MKMINDETMSLALKGLNLLTQGVALFGRHIIIHRAL
jgi:hypothetical protein